MPVKNFKFQISNFKLLQTGFSLVEVLVAVGVIAIITAVTIPNLKNFSRTQEIDNSASQLINILKRAQSSAAAHIHCTPLNASTSWQVSLNTTTASDTYVLTANCQTPPSQNLYTSPFAPTPTGSTTFQATTVPCAGENMTIYYTGLQMTYKCTSTPPLPVTSNIIITLDPSGFNKQVVIEPGGSIR